jgi:chemotaxis protein methyltransferase CheR
MKEYEVSEHAYQDFCDFLHASVGIVLGKKRQYLVKSRLSAFARELGYDNFTTFINDIISNNDRGLTAQCLELMTTNETFWFRDEYPFTLLAKHILPNIQKHKNSLKIWSSACASGQESYSIAMTILEHQRQHPQSFTGGVKILATDYSTKILEKAKFGSYDELALGRGLPLQMRNRYFEASLNNEMTLIKSIKEMVEFKQYNLLNSFTGLGQFDVVFCRNVLIYFDGNQKNEILKKIAACMPKHGILYLGAAESISGAEEFFTMKNIDGGLYYERL